MVDRESLASALELYEDPRFVVLALSPELKVIVEAARERLSQLNGDDQ